MRLPTQQVLTAVTNSPCLHFIIVYSLPHLALFDNTFFTILSRVILWLWQIVPSSTCSPRHAPLKAIFHTHHPRQKHTVPTLTQVSISKQGSNESAGSSFNPSSLAISSSCAKGVAAVAPSLSLLSFFVPLSLSP